MIDEYGPAIQAFQHISLAEDWEQLTRPADGSTPIEGLKIRPGLVCECGFKTIGKTHSGCKKHRRHVQVQCWNISRSRTCWIVNDPPPPQEPAADGPSAASQAGSRPFV